MIKGGGERDLKRRQADRMLNLGFPNQRFALRQTNVHGFFGRSPEICKRINNSLFLILYTDISLLTIMNNSVTCCNLDIYCT